MAQEFGKYLLQRKLAEGGMAEVFLARQSGMDGFEKPVVIKRILPHLSTEQQFIDMFFNEAKVAARLSHPSIVQIFDFGRVDGQYYIAMEFIHGEDLRNIAKAAEKTRKRPSMALVARIIADMLGGLHYAHTRVGPDGRKLGLVHRDISPQNILVTYEGGVKLVDFGIAKATESQQGQQTQAGLLKGKYAYMSPEQCRGRPLDARSDVFAVGILLWELITWKRLFRRDSDLATLVAVADEAIPNLSTVRNDIPPELDRICARALLRPVDQRYGSAQAMQADLEALIRKYGWEADSIRLQQFMRDLFADKLKLQDEAIRAAGLGSIEDFLVKADEGTQMAWMEPSDVKGNTPSGGLGLPSATPPRPGIAPTPPAQGSPQPFGATQQFGVAQPDTAVPQPVRPGAEPSQRITVGQGAQRMKSTPVAQPVPLLSATQPMQAPQPRQLANAASQQGQGHGQGQSGWNRPEYNTGSTLRHAVGQAVVRDPAGLSGQGPPQPRWKRVAVVVGTGLLVGAAALGAVFWPTGNDTVVTPAAGGDSQVAADVSKVHVILDLPAVVSIDGVPHPAARDSWLEVSPHAAHELRVKVEGKPDRPPMTIPPLSPLEVKTVRLRLRD